MARWRLRNPDSFPPSFHAAMRAGEGVDKLAWTGVSFRGLELAQEDWRLFRYCLRNFASHPSARWEFVLRHKTRRHYNKQTHRWELLLTSRQTVFADMAGDSQYLGEKI